MFSQFEQERHPKPSKPEHPTHPEHPLKPDLPVHPEHPPKPDHPKRITILVNGKEQILLPHVERISYEEIVKLAYGVLPTNPNTIFTIAYSNGPSSNVKGTLTKGRSVTVKEGMVFNVSKSDKS